MIRTKQINFKRKSSAVTAFLLTTALFTSCSSEDSNTENEADKPKPKVENIEIGLGNNEIGTIGTDFHFNVDIVAGDKIETVSVNLAQRASEKYEKVWKHEITWEQYKGAKNTNVHKHFDIPADAVEGKYDFIITVLDQNGTKLVETRTLNIWKAENLPVMPDLYAFNVFANDDFYYSNTDGAVIPNFKYKKGDKLHVPTTISGVKADGKMYIIMVNKKYNHRPETVGAIDFTKAIVVDVYSHAGKENVGSFSNIVLKDGEFVRPAPDLIIGGSSDNNTPANPVTGDKLWETGTYILGIVYTNSTYNMSVFHYTEVQVEL